MRVLLVSFAQESSNGWAVYTSTLASALRHAGVDVIENALDLERPLNYFTNPLKLRSAARHIEKVFKEKECDILHFTVEPYAGTYFFLPKSIQEKCVLTLHGSYAIRPLRSWITRFFAKKYYRSIPQLIAVSGYTKNRTIEELRSLGLSIASAHVEQNCTVIHNTIHLPEKKNQSQETDSKNILLVGGIKPIKGVVEALKGFDVYRKKYDTKAHYTLVGSWNPDSPYGEKVRKCIEEHDLEENVTITGMIDDESLKELYENADVYLMPSRTNPTTFEGFGIVFLEANAYGIPCIGPNTSGAAEAILEGKTGYQVDPENAEEIAERLSWILDEKRIDPEACLHWASDHTPDRTVDSVIDVYKQLT